MKYINNKKFFAILICILALFYIFFKIYVIQIDKEIKGYEFPITVKSSEWKQLSVEEMISETQIPDDILRKLTTEELIYTILNYPLLGNVYLYSNEECALTALKTQFNGAKELYERDNRLETLKYVYRNFTNKSSLQRYILLLLMRDNKTAFLCINSDFKFRI